MVLKELILIVLIPAILAGITTVLIDSTEYTKLQELGLCIKS